MARPVSKLNQIEATAMNLIAFRGLAQVTIKDIAREAGCAEGALYRHYRSKEEMAWLLFRREVERFGMRLRPLLESPESFVGRIEGAIRLFCTFFDEDRTIFSFILLTQHDFPKERRIRKTYNPDDLVMEFLRKAIAEGTIRIPDPALATAMVMGLVLQPATMMATGKLKGPMSKRIPAISEACCEVLGVRERRKR